MKLRDVVLIFGQTGSGKSTLAREVIAQYSRVVIFDTMSEYSGLVFYNASDFLDYMLRFPDTFYCCLRFENWSDYEIVARALFHIKNVLLVLEEADEYLDSASFASGTSDICHVVTRGRHERISILAISQRPRLISITLRAMATRVITFVQTEPADLAYLERWGFDADQISQLAQFEKVER